MHPNVRERRHEVRSGRGEKGLHLGRTRSGTRQARWPESHGQGNFEGRHAVRSGSRRVEITSSFYLTLESVPAFRLFSRRTTYAFGTIGPSNWRKHRHVAALRASWTLAPASAYGRKLPGVSSNISAEGGIDSTGVNHWLFPPGIEDHSGRTRQRRSTLPPRPQLAALEDPRRKPADQELGFLARRNESIVEGVGQAVAADKTRPSCTVARTVPPRQNTRGISGPPTFRTKKGRSIMRTMPLLFLLAILPGVLNAQQNPPPDQDKRSEDVVKRGEHVMGFSHEATT